MKRFLVIVSLAVALVAASAAPALAAVRVTARARTQAAAGTPAKIVFSAKVTRKGHTRRGIVRITVYRNGHAVRTITAKRVGSRYKAAWNLRTKSGRLAAAGVYRYKVRASTNISGRGSVSGKLRVRTPKVVTPTVPPEVTAPPVVTPVVNVVPTSTVEPTNTLVPTVTPVPVTAPPAPVSRWTGFYAQGNFDTAANLDALEALAGTHAAVVNIFVADSEGFPVNRARTASDRGTIPMVTLEFKSISSKGGLDAINSGSMDAYIAAFADKAKAHGSTVWIRPFHEMNGNWYAWAGTGTGNSPAKLVSAWKRTRDIFTARGADNVKFVWCVNSESVPNTAANAIEAYWPGEAYVDMIAIDGYNFGTSASWATWRSFGSALGDAYRRTTALTTKPLFLAETGCVEQGGSKAAWISDMFRSIPATYPRITGVCWFNATDPGQDFRIESSPESASAFKSAIASGY